MSDNPAPAGAESGDMIEQPVASLTRERFARARHLGLAHQLEDISGHRLAGLWHLLDIARDEALDENPDPDRGSALLEATMLYLAHISETLEAIRGEVATLERPEEDSDAIRHERFVRSV